MQKDFDNWNKNKKHIHIKNENRLYHEREVWWCSLGVNIGFEQDGDDIMHERPVLILKGLSRNTCLVAPLTTSLKKHKMRLPLGLIDNKLASVLISQIRVIDTKRLINKIAFVEHKIFEKIRKAAKDLL